MAEQESIHQGWLYTRDGSKFAPITLIDDVFAMNGKLYKDVVSGDINNLKTNLNTSLSTINTDNEKRDSRIDALEKNVTQKFDNLDTSDSDKLFIIDKNDNVMAYIDASGVHSLDFLVGEKGTSLADFLNREYQSFVTSTTSTLQQITKKLENFGDDESDKFFIVDKNNNVIAYFDAEGAKSTNFTTPEGDLNQVIADLGEEIGVREDLSKTVSAQGVAIGQIQNDIQYFNATEDDTKLFIIDKNNNVIAYIDELGLHSLNLITPNYNIEKDLPVIEKNIQDIHDVTVPSLRQEWQTADAGVKNYIDSELQYFDSSSEDTKLFIIDKNDNVIAYFDETGLHSLNVHSENYDMETNIKQLYDKLEQEVADRAAADQKVTTGYETADAGIYKHYDERLKHFDSSDQDTKLFIIDKNNNVIAYIDESGVHSLDFFSKSTSLESLLGLLNQEVNNRKTAITNLQTSIDTQIGTLQAEDESIREDFAAADETLKNDLEGQIDNVMAVCEANFEENSNAITNLQKYVDTADGNLQAGISANATQISGIKDYLSNSDLSGDSDAVYIIDKNDNVIAYFNSVGLTVTNVVLGKVGGRNMQVNGIFYGTPELKTYTFN